MKFAKSFFIAVLSLSSLNILVESLKLAPLYSPKNAVKNRYIVVFHNDTSKEYILSLNQKLVSNRKVESVHHIFERINGITVTLQPKNLERLRKDPKVKFVEKDSIVKAFRSSCGKQSDSGWCLQRVANSSTALNTFSYPNSAGKDVTCYVVDTGVNVNHPDLQGRAVRGASFVAREGDKDGNGHGTAVSSLIAGKTCGTAKLAKIIGVKVLAKDGSGYNSDILRGIEWCIQNKMRTRAKETQIINLSLGGGYSEASNEIVDRAHAAGLLVVVAAGNSNMNACEISPASAESALTVGATDPGDNIASFSNHGNCVKLFAPGVNCHLANALNNGFKEASGTSFASPLVAGVAACYLSENRSLSASELKSLILDTSKLNVVKSVPLGTPNRFVKPLCV